MAEVRRTRLCGDAYVFFRDSFSVVLVVNAKNLCQSLILVAIKEYSLYAGVVKLVIIQLEFLASFAAFSVDLALINYLDWSISDITPRSSRTDVANVAANLSETPVQLQAVASEGREVVIF